MATETTNSETRKRKPFLKTDTAKIGSGALITALFFILYNVFVSTQEDFAISGSGRITLNEAYTLIQNWSDTALLHIDSSGITTPLRGFVFNAVQLDSIINKNAALNPGDMASEVIFYIGRSGEATTGNWPLRHHYTKMRLIAVGVKNKSLLITDQRTQIPGIPPYVPSVYDKADPCPGPNCPKSKL